MNKVITDGVDLMPPAFLAGLNLWSSQDGTPGQTTYDVASGATIVSADSDFGTCLELQKSSATQKLRYTGQTPMLPGMYLRVSARIKAMSGNLPSVAIAGWAGGSGGAHVGGLSEVAGPVALTSYGDVVEVSAIIGAGNRRGVDMVWGAAPTFGHFGLDLSGPTGGVVRIESLRIEDVTHVFYRKLMDWVDVRDYGAKGDGITDDSAAFMAADLDAQGRKVLVSTGVYHLASNVTFMSEVRFEGTVTMPAAVRLSLTRNFDLPTYVDAFGNEELALKKALQALFNFSDHDSLDMRGLRVTLSAPLDVHAAVGNQDTFGNRRVLRNGQIESDGSPIWSSDVVTSLASYDATQPTTLSNVAAVSQVPVGALVEGVGVGREVYVRSKNIAAGTIELSLPLYGAPAQQSYSFTRFKYLLDFSGFTFLQRFNISDVEFLCQGNCSALMLPSDGLAFQLRDCFITTPKDRGITSIGHGCSGLQLDRNQFLSNEQALNVADRVTIGFNVNANDAKVRENRAVRFKHFAVMAGTGYMIQQNHVFQGDNAKTNQRTAGVILSHNSPTTLVSANYIDNCSLDWGNEHDATPANTGGFSFGSLTIEGNIFYAGQAPSWFRFIRIRPYGAGHYINGLTITGNTFKHFGGVLDRVDEVDASIAPLLADRFLNIRVEGNTFNNVSAEMMNPVTQEINQLTASLAWSADLAPSLPFSGKARRVVGVLAHNQINSATGSGVYTAPYAVPNLGPNGTEIKLHWSEPVSGKVYATVRADGLI